MRSGRAKFTTKEVDYYLAEVKVHDNPSATGGWAKGTKFNLEERLSRYYGTEGNGDPVKFGFQGYYPIWELDRLPWSCANAIMAAQHLMEWEQWQVAWHFVSKVASTGQGRMRARRFCLFGWSLLARWNEEGDGLLVKPVD